MEFKYSWCWECNAPTIDFGTWNLCCNRCDYDHKLILEAMDWRSHNPAPANPSAEEIDNVLNLDKITEEERLILNIFKGLSYGNFYWKPKKWADAIEHKIPTYEELCEKYNIEPTYDCKTGKQWSIDEKKEVYEKEGWESDANFEEEEIPWSEFLRRRRVSKIWYERKISRFHKNEGIV